MSDRRGKDGTAVWSHWRAMIDMLYQCGRVLVALILICGCNSGLQRWWSDREGADSWEIARVERRPFDHIVLDQGEVESSAALDIACQVKMDGGFGIPILWVVEEGKEVKAGEVLVELDSTRFEQKLKEQIIRVAAAKADVIRAQANVRAAEISLEQYLEGDYLVARKELLSQIAVAEQDLRNAEVALLNAQRLVENDLITPLQVDAIRFDRQAAVDKLEKAKIDLEVLDKLNREKNRVLLQANIDAAKANLESMQLRLREEEEELEEIHQQIANCTIVAPADGVVVYNNDRSFRGRMGGGFVVEAGALVRERQVILKLPNLDKLRVRAEVNESRIRYLEKGLMAIVQVEGVEGEMIGRVSHVARYAVPGAWYSSVREYELLVDILNPLPAVRTGMTAEIRVFVAHLDDAITVPISAVFESGNRTYCLRRNDQGNWDIVEVVLRSTDANYAAIESGLQPGDIVALQPSRHVGTLQLSEDSGPQFLAMERQRN